MHTIAHAQVPKCSTEILIGVGDEIEAFFEALLANSNAPRDVVPYFVSLIVEAEKEAGRAEARKGHGREVVAGVKVEK
jgi:hypothetical protein